MKTENSAAADFLFCCCCGKLRHFAAQAESKNSCQNKKYLFLRFLFGSFSGAKSTFFMTKHFSLINTSLQVKLNNK